ncbi:MAG TPA: GAF domain-containing protein [Candidatus Cybelea sp.]
MDLGGPAARAGVRRGDLIDIRANTLAERLSLFGAPLSGRPVILSVHRGRLQKELTVTPRPIKLRWDFWPGEFAALWLLLLAALIAWRRADAPQMRLLSLWLSLFIFAGSTFVFAAPWAWVYILFSVSNTVVAWSSVALLVAFASCFALPLSRARRITQWLSYAFVALAIAVAAVGIFGVITLWFDPLPFNSGLAGLVLFVAAVLSAVVCSVQAITASRGVERQRAVWTLVPIAVFFCVFTVTAIAASSSPSYAESVVLTIVTNLVFITASVALMYAALSRRLIDIGFFLNRAAVFTIVSTIVIGAFVLAEFAASEWFVSTSHTTSTVIGMGLALGLGLSMRFIHRHVDHFVDRVFFRKRHEDEAALRRFAHESSYITDRRVLLDRAVREVKEHANAADATIFVQDGAAAYISVETEGARTTASENDPGILALRAWHKPVDLEPLEDSVLRGELVFPMISRGTLVGLLVCGAKRSGEAYAPDESEALLALAHGVGTALDVLSAQGDRPNELVLSKLDQLREDVKRISRT